MAAGSRAFAATALLAVACLAPLAQAAEAPRPRVGLALGGGGARGSAHLGVLEVLEELRVPIDCIAGTSMGALVAGAYVAGIAPAEMKEAVRRADWTSMFDDSAGREAVDLHRKRIDDRFFTGLEFGVGKSGLRFREGAVAGEKVKLFFNQLVREDLGERRIEQLPLPLTLFATDIGTGERVAMRSGSLTAAMRASMSIPGAFAPVVIDGRKLVDGGLVENLPVAEALERCKADVVIAVNVGSPLLKPEDVTSVVSVVGQVVNLLTEQNVTKSLALLRPQDVYIRPDLGDFGGMEFTRQMEGAEAGRKAALAVAGRLRELALAPPQYREWRAAIRQPAQEGAPVIDEIQVADAGYVRTESIREGLRQRTGKPLDAKALSEDLVRIHSHGDLREIDYTVLRERERTVLRITPVGNPLGPDYLRFGLNFSSDFSTEAKYNVRALYRRTWLNRFDGEWLAALQIGSEQRFATEFYQPLDHRRLWFVRPYATVDRSTSGIFFDGERVADYQVLDLRAGLDAGANLGSWGQAKLGWIGRRASATLDTGVPQFPNLRETLGGVAAELSIDTHDQLFFPTRGTKLDLRYFRSTDVSGGKEHYARSEARWGGAFTAGDFLFLGGAERGKSTRGKLPVADLFALGGPRRLGGFATNQVLGDDLTYGRLEAQYRLTRPMPLLGLSLLAGVSVEAGRMKRPLTETALTGWLRSYGFYFASNTALGPMYLGYSYAPEGKGRVYLFIGTP